jgi:hypothetical protein
VAFATSPRKAVRLLRVYDVRPIDFFSGVRTDIPEDEKPVCMRCGKRHAKVYEIQADDGNAYTVGSGCVGRAFAAEWAPAESELKLARRTERDRENARIEADRASWLASTAADLVKRCPLRGPLPAVTSGIDVSPHGTRRTRIDMGPATVWSFEGVTLERMRALGETYVTESLFDCWNREKPKMPEWASIFDLRQRMMPMYAETMRSLGWSR